MKASTKTSEELTIALTCISLVLLYSYGVIYEWKATAIVVPILAAILVGVFLRLRIYWILRCFNGEYLQYNMDGSLIKNKKNTIKFSLRNLIRIRPILYVKQVSEKKGNWESYITVSEVNPLISSGFYKYIESGKNGGGSIGDWGVHELHMDPEDEKIHVKAVSKSGIAEVEYLLKKQ